MVKAREVEGVKTEPMDSGDEIKQEWQQEEEEEEVDEDPIDYHQYYPSMLPHRCEGWGLGSSCPFVIAALGLAVDLSLLLALAHKIKLQ